MPDWTERLTEKVRTDLHETDYESATTTELQDLHLSALRTVAALRALVEAKDGALDAAAKHVTELENAWLRGALEERDGQGGTRSNRNVQVRGMVLDARALTEADMLKRMEEK